jgi:uncharacterized protein (TIGR02246 family)
LTQLPITNNFKNQKLKIMKQIIFLFLISSFAFVCHAQTDADKTAVNQVATSFYNSWNNHDFKDMSSYTTEDVEFINPVGVWWNGRGDAQKSLQHLHDTMLKNTPLTALSTTTHFITPSVAVVTIIAKVGTFYPPDGVDNGHNKSGDNRGVETMVIVKQNGKWLLALSQSTDINEDVVRMDPLSKTRQ